MINRVHKFLIFLLAAGNMLQSDTLILKNGLKLQGTFKGGTATTIQFETSGSVQEVSVKDIDSIVFSAPAATTETAAAAAVPAPAVPGALIPAGTKMIVRTTEPVNTQSNPVGSKFKAELDQDVLVNGAVLVKKGTLVYGTVLESIGGRRIGNQRLVVTFSELSINNQPIPIQTDDVGVEGGRGGAARAVGAGALIGAAAGDAGAGAAVGAGVALLAGGNHIQIPAGATVEVTLKNPVTLP
jgi:hypothetical protein